MTATTLVIAAAALGLFYAGWQITRPPRLNVLLVTLDTTRADRIGCYGDRQALTPVLDKLAERGVVFEHAYAPIPLTLPSHASMFTGLYPPEHGIHTNGKNRLGDGVPTLGEKLQSRGYETAAFVASFVLDRKFGLARGFQTYDDDLTGTEPADEALHRHRDGAIVIQRALEWLRPRVAKPFFCWVHLYDPHFPYESHPDLFGEQFQDRPYDGEIAYADILIGRLTEFLRANQLESRTLLVVVGDHGEGLNDHGERQHGQMLYNSTLHVPWIIVPPSAAAGGKRIETPVSLVDLSPTILEATRSPAAANISGRSLMPAVRGEELPVRPLYAQTDEPWLESGWSPLRALITDRWKYIRTPQVELYHLQADPQERTNLAVTQAEQVELLAGELTDLESGLQQRTGAVVALSDKERQKLSALGYVGHAGEGSKKEPTGKLHDIKQMIGHYNALTDARALLDEERFDEAAAALEALLASAPDYELAELALGDVYLKQKKLDDAWTIYHGVVERNPESALALLHLGDVREAQGRFAEALDYYRQALQHEPDAAKLNYNIGRALVVLGRDDEAIPQLEYALELDPGFVFAHVELGSAFARQGLREKALAQYRLALQYDPKSVYAHMNAASLLSQQGRTADALSHLKSAAEIAPQDAEIRFRLGVYLAELRQFAEARSHLETTLELEPNHAEARQLLNRLPRNP